MSVNQDSEQRQHKSLVAVWLGLVANIFLAIAKTAIGIVGHSPALLADGINSTSDVAYYVVVSVFIRMARKPADDEHPYGHSQLESIAALVVGAFVVTTAIAIFWDAINNVYELFMGEASFKGASIFAFGMALLTIFIKIGLTFTTLKIGRQTDNPAVLALAYDHRNDIFSASAAAIGIFLGRMGLPWVDPLAGALVALVIMRTGIEILRQSSIELMDAVPSQALARQINKLLKSIPGILQVEEVRSHRFGPYLVVNLTIGVDGSLTVMDGDRISSQAEALLYANIEFLQQVHIHYHPAQRHTASQDAASLPVYMSK